MARLDGLVTLISGAAAGIGEGIARAFLSEGASVILTDIRDPEGESLALSLARALPKTRCPLRRRLGIRNPGRRRALRQAGRRGQQRRHHRLRRSHGRSRSRTRNPRGLAGPSSRPIWTAPSWAASTRSGAMKLQAHWLHHQHLLPLRAGRNPAAPRPTPPAKPPSAITRSPSRSTVRSRAGRSAATPSTPPPSSRPCGSRCWAPVRTPSGTHPGHRQGHPAPALRPGRGGRRRRRAPRLGRSDLHHRNRDQHRWWSASRLGSVSETIGVAMPGAPSSRF